LSRAVAVSFIVAGFAIAVPVSYIIATMSDDDLLQLIRWGLVAVLVAAGSILTATGLILLKGIGSASGED